MALPKYRCKVCGAKISRGVYYRSRKCKHCREKKYYKAKTKKPPKMMKCKTEGCDNLITERRYNGSGLCKPCWQIEYWEKLSPQSVKGADQDGNYPCRGYCDKPCPHNNIVTKYNHSGQCKSCRNAQWRHDRRAEEKIAKETIPKKAFDVFSAYDLQRLSGNRLVKTIDKILSGTYNLNGVR